MYKRNAIEIIIFCCCMFIVGISFFIFQLWRIVLLGRVILVGIIFQILKLTTVCLLAFNSFYWEFHICSYGCDCVFNPVLLSCDCQYSFSALYHVHFNHNITFMASFLVVCVSYPKCLLYLNGYLTFGLEIICYVISLHYFFLNPWFILFDPLAMLNGYLYVLFTLGTHLSLLFLNILPNLPCLQA